MITFKIGDVVTEKGEESPMTVRGIQGNMIRCVWFKGTEFNQDLFKPRELVKLMTKQDSERG